MTSRAYSKIGSNTITQVDDRVVIYGTHFSRSLGMRCRRDLMHRTRSWRAVCLLLLVGSVSYLGATAAARTSRQDATRPVETDSAALPTNATTVDATTASEEFRRYCQGCH